MTLEAPPTRQAPPLSAVGYAVAAVELADQLAGAGIPSATVLLSTGSCGTQAGLVRYTRRALIP